MRKNLLFVLVLSTTLAFLGVYFYAPGHVANLRLLGVQSAKETNADGKASAAIANPALPEAPPGETETRGTSGAGPQAARWPTVFPEILKKSLQATASRRPPPPPTSPDDARQKAAAEAAKKQGNSTNPATKTNPLNILPTISGIPIRCNVKRPSCRRWLHLQQKKQRRKNSLAVR